MCFCEGYKSKAKQSKAKRSAGRKIERDTRVMEAQHENSIHTNSYKITIGVCVMEKKVKCGSEVLFLVCFFSETKI